MSHILEGACYAVGAVFALAAIILTTALIVKTINTIKQRRDDREMGAWRFRSGRIQ